MEGADTAFFSASRRYGLSDTVISLVEHADLDWRGRFEYLLAVANKRRTDLYAMDLICLIARGLSAKWGGTFNGTFPSDLEYDIKTQDNRSAKQIAQGILKRLRGG